LVGGEGNETEEGPTGKRKKGTRLVRHDPEGGKTCKSRFAAPRGGCPNRIPSKNGQDKEREGVRQRGQGGAKQRLKTIIKSKKKSAKTNSR